MARNEDEYFAQINKLLERATPVGAYCLAFAEVLRQECGIFPPPDIMREFVECRTVAQGLQVLERIRAFQRSHL